VSTIGFSHSGMLVLEGSRRRLLQQGAAESRGGLEGGSYLSAIAMEPWYPAATPRVTRGQDDDGDEIEPEEPESMMETTTAKGMMGCAWCRGIDSVTFAGPEPLVGGGQLHRILGCCGAGRGLLGRKTTTNHTTASATPWLDQQGPLDLQLC